MKAHIEYDWMRPRHKIWLYTDAPHRMQFRMLGPDEFEWQEIAEGETTEPSLVLPDEPFKALVAATGEFLPPSAATDRHLADAIAVRDRLLVLVEQS